MSKSVMDKDTKDDFDDIIGSNFSEQEEKKMEKSAEAGTESDNEVAATHKKRQDEEDPESFFKRVNKMSDDEKSNLEKQGFLVNQSDQDSALKTAGGGRLKRYTKKKVALFVGGAALSLGFSALGLLFSILPFKLQHVKNVFSTQIGGIKDTVLVTRSGNLYSRSFFFAKDNKGNPVFDGYKEKGLVAILTGKNVRSNRLLTDMRSKGFDVQVSKTGGSFTGQIESINGKGVTIDSGSAFRDTWNNQTRGKSLARSEIRSFFNEEYSSNSRFWRARKARTVYRRYGLSRFRTNFLQELAVRKANNIRIKIRKAFYSEPENPPRVSAPVSSSTVDPNDSTKTTTSTVDVGSEIEEQAKLRQEKVRNSTKDLSRSSAAEIESGGNFKSGAIKGLVLFAAVNTACRAKKFINLTLIASRQLRAKALTIFAAAFMSVADIALTGEADAQDIGVFSAALDQTNPETGRDFFGSGAWQWASTGQGTVNDDIRDEYSVGGGFGGKLAKWKSKVNVPGCDIITNPLVQLAGAAAGIYIAVSTGGVFNAVVGAGAGAAIGATVGYISALLLPRIIDMVAGTIITGDEFGDQMASAMVSGYVAYLGLQASNHGMRPITNIKLGILTKERDRQIALDQADMSLYERYLSPNNYRSVTSVAAISMPSSIRGAVLSFSSILKNPLSLIASPFGVLSNNNGFAAAQGSTQCADEDITGNDIATDPFCNPIYAEDVAALAIDPVDNLKFMLGRPDQPDTGYVDVYGQPQKNSDGGGDLTENGAKYQEYLDRCVGLYDVIHDNTSSEADNSFTDYCYSGTNLAYSDGAVVAMSPNEIAKYNDTTYNFNDLQVAYHVQDGTYDDSPDAGKVYAQTGVDLGTRIPTLIERFRMLRLDEVLLDSMAEDFNGDYGVDQPTSQNYATNTPPSSTPITNDRVIGNPYTSTQNSSSAGDVPCDTRTTDLGLKGAFVNGSLVSMRMCSLPNLPSTGDPEGQAIVNAKVSGAWFALVDAASKDGITLSASSSFKVVQNGRNATAQNKLAQSGVFIEFTGMGTTTEPAATCSLGSRASNSSNTYIWLANNADRFGFSQYKQVARLWGVNQDGYTNGLMCVGTTGLNLPATPAAPAAGRGTVIR